MIELAAEEEVMKIDAYWVLKRAALLADFNIRRFIKEDKFGNAVYDFSEATDDDWYCIHEYTTEEISRGQGDERYMVDKLKIKSYDKLRALELVGKHVDVQAFKDQVEHTGQIGMVIASDEDGL
jgi:phage terminase small subunit